MVAMIIIALIVNLVLYRFYAIKIVNDTSQYLYYGDLIRNGTLYRDHYFWYIGYVLFLSFLKIFSSSPALVVVAQVILFIVALMAVYDASKHIFRHSESAFISCLLYLLFIEIPTWNFYLLPESLYASFVCFSIAAIVRYNGKLKEGLIALALTAITFFIKPTGIAILIMFLLNVILFHSKAWRKNTYSRSIIWITTAVFILLLGNTMVDSFTVVENYSKGEIIYGVSSMPDYQHTDMLMISPPEDLVIPASDHAPVVRIMLFIFHNPVYFIKLSSTKGLYFILHIKPYYSLHHNLFIVLFLFPIYFFSLWTLFREATPGTIKIILSIYILFQITIVMFTVEDWDGRFLVPIIPPLVILAGRGLQLFLQKFQLTFIDENK